MHAMHGRRIHDVEGKYYADGEDAYEMRKYLGSAPPPPAGKKGGAGRAKKEAEAAAEAH